MGTMRAGFEGGQIVRIIAALPAIEGLAADPEMATGAGHVLRAAVEIHPGQAQPRLPAQRHPGSGQLARAGVVSLCELAFRHSIRVSLIILNETRTFRDFRT